MLYVDARHLMFATAVQHAPDSLRNRALECFLQREVQLHETIMSVSLHLCKVEGLRSILQ
jgi:hypothetical protein